MGIAVDKKAPQNVSTGSISSINISVLDCSDSDKLVQYIRQQKGIRNPDRIFNTLEESPRKSFPFQIEDGRKDKSNISSTKHNNKDRNDDDVANNTPSSSYSNKRNMVATNLSKRTDGLYKSPRVRLKRISKSIHKQTLKHQFRTQHVNQDFEPGACSTPIQMKHSDLRVSGVSRISCNETRTNNTNSIPSVQEIHTNLQKSKNSSIQSVKTSKIANYESNLKINENNPVTDNVHVSSKMIIDIEDEVEKSNSINISLPKQAQSTIQNKKNTFLSGPNNSTNNNENDMNRNQELVIIPIIQTYCNHEEENENRTIADTNTIKANEIGQQNNVSVSKTSAPTVTQKNKSTSKKNSSAQSDTSRCVQISKVTSKKGADLLISEEEENEDNTTKNNRSNQCRVEHSINISQNKERLSNTHPDITDSELSSRRDRQKSPVIINQNTANNVLSPQKHRANSHDSLANKRSSTAQVQKPIARPFTLLADASKLRKASVDIDDLHLRVSSSIDGSDDNDDLDNFNDNLIVPSELGAEPKNTILNITTNLGFYNAKTRQISEGKPIKCRRAIVREMDPLVKTYLKVADQIKSQALDNASNGRRKLYSKGNSDGEDEMLPNTSITSPNQSTAARRKTSSIMQTFINRNKNASICKNNKHAPKNKFNSNQLQTAQSFISQWVNTDSESDSYSESQENKDKYEDRTDKVFKVPLAPVAKLKMKNKQKRKDSILTNSLSTIFGEEGAVNSDRKKGTKTSKYSMKTSTPSVEMIISAQKEHDITSNKPNNTTMKNQHEKNKYVTKNNTKLHSKSELFVDKCIEDIFHNNSNILAADNFSNNQHECSTINEIRNRNSSVPISQITNAENNPNTSSQQKNSSSKGEDKNNSRTTQLNIKSSEQNDKKNNNISTKKTENEKPSKRKLTLSKTEKDTPDQIESKPKSVKRGRKAKITNASTSEHNEDAIIRKSKRERRPLRQYWTNDCVEIVYDDIYLSAKANQPQSKKKQKTSTKNKLAKNLADKAKGLNEAFDQLKSNTRPLKEKNISTNIDKVPQESGPSNTIEHNNQSAYKQPNKSDLNDSIQCKSKSMNKEPTKSVPTNTKRHTNKNADKQSTDLDSIQHVNKNVKKKLHLGTGNKNANKHSLESLSGDSIRHKEKNVNRQSSESSLRNSIGYNNENVNNELTEINLTKTNSLISSATKQTKTASKESNLVSIENVHTQEHAIAHISENQLVTSQQPTIDFMDKNPETSNLNNLFSWLLDLKDTNDNDRLNETIDKLRTVSPTVTIASLNSLTFQNVDGVEYSYYATNENNFITGFMRFQPGTKKKNAKTQLHVKFLNLIGSLEIIIENSVSQITKSGDLISVNEGSKYKIKNNSNKLAVLFYMKKC